MNTVSQRFIKTQFLKHLLHGETIRIWKEIQEEIERIGDRCARIREALKQSYSFPVVPNLEFTYDEPNFYSEKRGDVERGPVIAPIVAKQTDPNFNPVIHIRERYDNERVSGEAYFCKGKWNRYEDLNLFQQRYIEITAKRIRIRKEEREDRKLLYGPYSNLYGKPT